MSSSPAPRDSRLEARDPPILEWVMRHLTPLPGTSVLVAMSPSADGPARIAHRVRAASVRAFHLSLAATGPDAAFGLPRPDGTGPAGAGVIFLPRERRLAELLATHALDAVAPGAPVWLAGLTREGIRSLRPRVNEWLAPPVRAEAGRRGLVYRGRARPDLAVERDLEAWTGAYTAELADGPLRVVSLPGVFSADGLDDGTRLLLSTLTTPPPDGAGVLDFGCGAGVVGAALKRRWPRARVTMTDAFWPAIEASRRTLAANGLDETGLVASDGFDGLEGRYALIASNPPFHRGGKTDLSVVRRFVHDAAGRLETEGRLRIVAHRFLPYPRLLETAFAGVSAVAEEGAFRVYDAVLPR